VQSYTPQLALGPLNQSPPNKYSGALWGYLIIPVTLFLAFMVQFSSIFKDHHNGGMLIVLIVGIVSFAIVFGINSSVHSYLVVRYADGDKVAQVSSPC
jgi:hypothetical protein